MERQEAMIVDRIEADERAKADVVAGCRVLQAAGQTDMVWGHVSVRAAEDRGVWLKGSNLGFDEVGTADVILLSWDGEIIEGTAGRHVEYPIHLEIMRQRPDVNSVVHTHPLYSIAFAATGWRLRPLSHEGCYFVPPDIPRFTKTTDVVGTPELGEALARKLADGKAILMPGHGIAAVGTTIGEAVAGAIHLERACQISLLAGENAEATSDEEALEKRKSYSHRMAMSWSYLSRSLDVDRALHS